MSPTLRKIDLSLIIPAYNEEKKIRATTEAYLHALEKDAHIRSFEIIIVSNNCSDSTPAIASELAKKHKEIVHVDIPQLGGKGRAVRTGFAAARFPFLAFVDADNATEPSQFLKLVPSMLDPTVGAAIASRLMPDSQLVPPQPLHRRVLGMGYTTTRELILGLGIKDSQCGAKIFRKECVEPFNWETTGWSFDVELLLRVIDCGFHVREIGISWKDSRESSVSVSTPIEMLLSLLKIRLKRMRAKQTGEKNAQRKKD